MRGKYSPKSLKWLGTWHASVVVFKSLTTYTWGCGTRPCPLDASRCRYCALPHATFGCTEKISKSKNITQKCLNFRQECNANSPLRIYFLKDRKVNQKNQALPLNKSNSAHRINDVGEIPTPTKVNSDGPCRESRDTTHSTSTNRSKSPINSNTSINPQHQLQHHFQHQLCLHCIWTSKSPTEKWKICNNNCLGICRCCSWCSNRCFPNQSSRKGRLRSSSSIGSLNL